jgi:hypothetical protein
VLVPAALARTAPADGTETCLKALPHAIAGLPPATPPATPLLFVYRLPSGMLNPPMVAQLSAWSSANGRTYLGATLAFFKSVRAAKAYMRLGFGGTLVGTTVVGWDHAPAQWRGSVLRCLRSPGGTHAPARSAPRASLATFAGGWGGHTRGLQIARDGRARESVDDGCCTRVYDLAFRILSVTGTVTRATATYRVTAYLRHSGGPRLRAGELGRLELRDGIVSNDLTGVYYCSDPAWGATGACGA